MNRKVLFLHLPKTAGSSIKSFLKDTLGDFCLQANSAGQLALADPRLVRVRDMADLRRVLGEHGGLALHVDSNFDEVSRTTDFRSLSHLVFEPGHYDFFGSCTILAMLRHPFRRFLSEYEFVRRMKEANPGFLPDLEVGSVGAYLERVHPNAQLHFLLERDLYKPRTLTDEDLARVKERIAAYPIHVGIHERFDESIAYFARILGRRFTAADLPSLNVGANAPQPPDPAVESVFMQRNRLDLELYYYAARLPDTRKSTI